MLIKKLIFARFRNVTGNKTGTSRSRLVALLKNVSNNLRNVSAEAHWSIGKSQTMLRIVFVLYKKTTAYINIQTQHYIAYICELIYAVPMFPTPEHLSTWVLLSGFRQL